MNLTRRQVLCLSGLSLAALWPRSRAVQVSWQHAGSTEFRIYARRPWETTPQLLAIAAHAPARCALSGGPHVVTVTAVGKSESAHSAPAMIWI